ASQVASISQSIYFIAEGFPFVLSHLIIIIDLFRRNIPFVITDIQEIFNTEGDQ
ncbi:12866_t:CDS:1, partial [Funneliformis geosporum]